MLRPNPPTSWMPVSVKPVVDATAYVDETAVLIGSVTVGARVVICPYAVLRADEGFPITVGEESNIQDGVIIHALKGSGVEIGPRSSLAHGAIVHGPCAIGPASFVGFRAVLLRTRIGSNCFIGHGAVIISVDVPDNVFVPPGMVLTQPSQVAELPMVPPELREFAAEVVRVNVELAAGYRRLVEAEDRILEERPEVGGGM